MVWQLSMPGIPDNHPAEDALSFNPEGTVFAVADGVTRSVGEDGRYPDPSPARMAADIFCQTVEKRGARVATQQHIRELFAEANEGIQKLNAALGFAPDPDYFVRDLAGTVAALAVRQGRHIVYGFIGDCGVAVVDKQGQLLWSTPDEVAPVGPFFPRGPKLSKKERQVIIRRDYRNEPDAQHPTYGVLTGESQALFYVKTGIATLHSGDVLVVYSDGALPIFEDKQLRKLLIGPDSQALEKAISTLRQTEGRITSELTLLATRF